MKIKGSNSTIAHYKIKCNFLKKPIQASPNGFDFFLIDEDNDDDETTSKTKNKFGKGCNVPSFRLNAFFCEPDVFYYLFTSSDDPFIKKFLNRGSLFSKRSISLAICCLR